MNRIGIIIDIMVELRIESPLGHVIWASTSGILSILLLNIGVCHCANYPRTCLICPNWEQIYLQLGAGARNVLAKWSPEICWLNGRQKYAG